VKASLARISSKFEKVADLERDDEPDMSMERKLHDRFDAIKAKIGHNSELKGDKKIAAAMKSIGSKFDRLASMEREEEDEDEEEEEDEDEEETKEGDMERADMERAMHDRFESISAKIARSPELKRDAKVMAAVKRINAKFDRLAHKGSADFELQSPWKKPSTIKPAKSITSAKRPSIFKSASSKMAAMKAKYMSQKPMMPESDEEEDSEEEEDLEALSSRFSAIQNKINQDKSLKSDAKIQATLKRISSKFERDLERDADEEPADLERLESHFEAIKHKINAEPELKRDSKVQASLKRISAKFDKLEDA